MCPYIITESLCHKHLLIILACSENLTLKMKSHKKNPLWLSAINYHITGVIIILHEIRWYGRAIKTNIWHCQRHFQSTIRDLRKFAPSQLFILWLSTHLFSTNSHSNLFLCAICIWLSFLLRIWIIAFIIIYMFVFLVLIGKFIIFLHYCQRLRYSIWCVAVYEYLFLSIL